MRGHQSAGCACRSESFDEGDIVGGHTNVRVGQCSSRTQRNIWIHLLVHSFVLLGEFSKILWRRNMSATVQNLLKRSRSTRRTSWAGNLFVVQTEGRWKVRRDPRQPISLLKQTDNKSEAKTYRPLEKKNKPFKSSEKRFRRKKKKWNAAQSPETSNDLSKAKSLRRPLPLTLVVNKVVGRRYALKNPSQTRAGQKRPFNNVFPSPQPVK